MQCISHWRAVYNIYTSCMKPCYNGTRPFYPRSRQRKALWKTVIFTGPGRDQSHQFHNALVPYPTISYSEQKCIFLFWMMYCRIWDRFFVAFEVFLYTLRDQWQPADISYYHNSIQGTPFVIWLDAVLWNYGHWLKSGIGFSIIHLLLHFQL